MTRAGLVAFVSVLALGGGIALLVNVGIGLVVIGVLGLLVAAHQAAPGR